MVLAAEIKVNGIKSVDLRPISQSLGETRVVIPYKPRDAFRPLHFAEQRFAICVCHRRAGKTVSAINALIKAIFTCPRSEARAAYVAPTFSQAKDISWSYLKTFTRNIPGIKYMEAELKVVFPNGATIRLYGAENADRLRGLYFDMVVVDEYASMNPEIWTEVIRPALMDRMGKAIFLGTPKGRDAFYDLWRVALKNPKEWFSLMLKASETGLLAQSELDEAKELMTPSQYAREFECSFEAESTNQFISLMEVNEAFARKGHGLGPRVIGVDVARFGEDRTVIVVRNGDTIEYLGFWSGLDLMQTSAQVAETIDRYKPLMTYIDGVGLGGGVVDRLRHLGYTKTMDVNAGRSATRRDQFTNLRAEMWFKMRLWIRERACLEVNKELADDLTSLTYEFDLKSRLKLESKDDLKARGLPSPDTADALALTFAQDMAPESLSRLQPYVMQMVPMADPLEAV